MLCHPSRVVRLTVAAIAVPLVMAMAVGCASSGPAAAPAPPTPAASAPAFAPKGTPSRQVAVLGDVNSPLVLNIDALRRFPTSVIRIGNETWAGPGLWTVLTQAGLRTDPRVRGGTLGMYVVASSTSGERAVLSLPELDPSYGNRAVIVAWQRNGGPVGATGDIRLIVAGDVRLNRSIENLSALVVRTAPGLDTPP